MAKLFYTLEEAAAKLGKSTDEVMNMAKAGQLQELRNNDQVLFRRSAIDQLAGDSDAGSEINLDAIDVPTDDGDLQLSGSSPGLGDGLSLEDTGAGFGMEELRLDDDLTLSDDKPSAPVAPIAASGADDSMMLDELTLADDEPAAPAARAPAPAPSPAASATGISAGSALGLADSGAGSFAGSKAGSRIMSGSGAPIGNEDSMAMGMSAQPVEAVGSGSGLLDISSDESFFGAQMIEESMGGEEAALPEGAADLFGDGAAVGGEEAAPVTAGTAAAVTFGAPQLAEARDPKFSGFAAGAMVAAFLGLVGMGWAVTEISVGNYVELAKLIAENWMYVVGGLAGGVLVFGGIGFGIGKATA
jgi:hypothetical protein